MKSEKALLTMILAPSVKKKKKESNMLAFVLSEFKFFAFRTKNQGSNSCCMFQDI